MYFMPASLWAAEISLIGTCGRGSSRRAERGEGVDGGGDHRGQADAEAGIAELRHPLTVGERVADGERRRDLDAAHAADGEQRGGLHLDDGDALVGVVAGLEDGLLRLSVGIEEADDLVADLDRALAGI